jgi:O-antigen/teichoic acid export membrane protein
VAAKLALYILAAARMDDQECGAMFLCLTWVMLSGTLSRLGLERALSRLIAAELALGQGVAARRVLVQGLAIIALTGLVAGMATFVSAPFAARHLFHSAAAEAGLRAAALTIPANSLACALGFSLIGFGRTVLAQALQNVVWSIGLLCGVVGGLDHAWSLMLLMAATQAISVSIGAVALLADRLRLKEDVALPQGSGALPSPFRTALPLYVVELVQVSINSLPVLVLGIFADSRSVSIFSIAQRASMLVLVVLFSLTILASPQFAALHRRGDWADLAALNRRTQLAGMVLGGGVCLALAAGGETLLSLIAPGFAAGVPALLIMAAGQAVSALYAGQDGLLAMTGQGPALRTLNLAQFAVMALLSMLLIPRFGAMGAAAVSAVATAQGGLGAAMVVAAFFPAFAPRFAPPMPAMLGRVLHKLPDAQTRGAQIDD